MWLELLNKASLQYVVAAACPWMGAWLCLMMQPSHLPIDLNMLLEVKARSKVRKKQTVYLEGEIVLKKCHKYLTLATSASMGPSFTF